MNLSWSIIRVSETPTPEANRKEIVMKKNVLALQKLSIDWDDPLALSSLLSSNCCNTVKEA